MIKNLLLLALLFYVLILVQTTILLGFPLVIIAVVFINIFYRKTGSNAGIYSAFLGGLFLDIFSSGILGFWVLILLVPSFCFRLILNKYVRTPVFKT